MNRIMKATFKEDIYTVLKREFDRILVSGKWGNPVWIPISGGGGFDPDNATRDALRAYHYRGWIGAGCCECLPEDLPTGNESEEELDFYYSPE